MGDSNGSEDARAEKGIAAEAIIEGVLVAGNISVFRQCRKVVRA